MEDPFSLMTIPGKIETKNDIYQCLKNWIIYSDLKPGEPIKERNLSSLFNISRTSLREILQLLSYQRLVVIKPRKGVFVAPIDIILIKAVFETRLPLEKRAVALVAARRSKEDVLELERLIKALKAALKNNNPEGFIRLDQKYHETMGRMTRNPVMAESLEALHNPCLRYWFLNRQTFEPYKETFTELQHLTQAIKDKNPDLATQLNGIHVSGFLALLNAGKSKNC